MVSTYKKNVHICIGMFVCMCVHKFNALWILEEYSSMLLIHDVDSLCNLISGKVCCKFEEICLKCVNGILLNFS